MMRLRFGYCGASTDGKTIALYGVRVPACEKHVQLVEKLDQQLDAALKFEPVDEGK
jgi:hypothetical protein